MIQEALDYLAAQAVKASAPHKLIEDQYRALYLADGNQISVAKDPAPRAHKVETLRDILKLADRFRDSEPLVWYDFNQVVLVIDDDKMRLETATLALKPTETFSLLCNLRHSPSWHDQKAMIRLVRVQLAGCMPSSELLDVIRKIKFENGAVVSSEIQSGKSSYDKNVVAKCESLAGTIPEEVRCDCRIWTNSGEDERYAITCAVDTMPDQAKLQLIPLPDEIERVKNLAVGSLAARLLDGLGDVPCYFGRPA